MTHRMTLLPVLVLFLLASCSEEPSETPASPNGTSTNTSSPTGETPEPDCVGATCKRSAGSSHPVSRLPAEALRRLPD